MPLNSLNNYSNIWDIVFGIVIRIALCKIDMRRGPTITDVSLVPLPIPTQINRIILI